MKKILLMVGCLAAFNLSSLSFADEAHPCKSLEVACKAAGYYKGGSDVGKGLYKNCVEPLAQGKVVEGVTAPEADIRGCKVKIAEMEKENRSTQ